MLAYSYLQRLGDKRSRIDIILDKINKPGISNTDL